MREQRKPLINRALYKAIKKYDHLQMENFARELYRSGFEAGRKSVPGMELEEILKAVKETKGIGETKFAAIRENVDKLYRGQQEQGVSQKGAGLQTGQCVHGSLNKNEKIS